MAKIKAGFSNYDHSGYDGDHSVIAKIAEEHGPAVAHHHFSDGAIHNVTTHHEDGHIHFSQNHPTYEHAHDHIAIAHGIA